MFIPLTARGEDHGRTRVQGGWLQSFRSLPRINSRARTERKDHNQSVSGQGAMSLPTDINGFTKWQIKHDRSYISLRYLIWDINEHH